ncbi:hypothetical protein R1T08_00655 [Streptomyces sp. SBC-4]|nr:hypothetical protein [Streptomyces sp. SBC-4]MDV5142873.1 hypothetical protein [Streptomyces sp. SBC-4]
MERFQHQVRLLPTTPFGPVRVKADPYLVRTGTYVKVDRVDEKQFAKALGSVLGSTDADFGRLISAVLRNGLDELLSTATAGIHRRDCSLVTVDGENIVRLDSMLWLYNFDGAGLTADVRNAFAYGAALSSVRIDEIDHELPRLMVSHMVNKIPGLIPEERKEKTKELHARLMRDKDGRVAKRRRLAALTRAVNDRVPSAVGISVGRDGFLHLASPDTGLIWRAAPGYEVIPVAGGGTDYGDGIPALKAKLEHPFAVAPDRTTNGFVIADFGGARGNPGMAAGSCGSRRTAPSVPSPTGPSCPAPTGTTPSSPRTWPWTAAEPCTWSPSASAPTRQNCASCASPRRGRSP